MYRLECASPCIQQSSSGIDHVAGDITLCRQRAFKLEQLVPFIPTQDVAVAFPPLWSPTLDLTAASKVALKSVVERLSNDATTGSAEGSEILLSFERVAGDLLCRSNKPGALHCVVHSASTNIATWFAHYTFEQVVDALDFMSFVDDWCYRMAGDSAFEQLVDAFSAAARVPVVFPIDPRPLSAVGESSLVEDFYSLPSCMLCLDRIERSISGLLASPCRCEMLKKRCYCYPRSTCELCQRALEDADDVAVSCTDCTNPEEPWLCLICGHIGCSRYRQQHANSHFAKTGHEFTLSLSTLQIWDYESDRFVHRLLVKRVRNLTAMATTSTPLATSPEVEKMTLPELTDSSTVKEVVEAASNCKLVLEDAKYDVKVEQLSMEYSRLLASELAFQRAAYEQQLRQSEEGAIDEREIRQMGILHDEAYGNPYACFDTLNAPMEELRRAAAAYFEDVFPRDILQTNELTALAEEEAALQRTHEAGKRALGAKLLANQDALQALQRESAALESELNDVTLALETRRRIAQQMGPRDSVANAVMMMTQLPNHKKRRNTKTRK